MKKIPITVYILDVPKGYGPEWYVGVDDGAEPERTFGHSELGQAVAMAVQYVFQKKAIKAMGE
jgi:hypothetical protein